MRKKIWSLIFVIVLALALLAALLWLVGAGHASAQSSGPSGTLELVITSKKDRAVEASGTFSNSFGSWATCLYWGDGPSVCFDGVSGTFTETHQYPGPGVYTATLIVEGEGGPFIKDAVVSFFDPPTGVFTTTVVDNRTFVGTVSGEYQNAKDWGACITDWGHEGESNQAVCFPGVTGVFTDVQHIWPGYGLYTLTYKVRGPEETVVLTNTIQFLREYFLPVVFKPLLQPEGTLDVLVSNPGIREVMASGIYKNSQDWGTCLDWGDSEPGVCFPGISGTFSNVTHQYEIKGKYTITLAVIGVPGTTPHEVSQEVQIP